MIDIHGLLFEFPTWDEVVEYFKRGEDLSEKSLLIAAVRRHLLTVSNQEQLKHENLTLELLFMRHYNVTQNEVVKALYTEWDAKLGFPYFTKWLP